MYEDDKMSDLLAYLETGAVLVADGATGTMLQSMGLATGTAPELWNVEKPDAVRTLHRAYLDAGSEVILTNTFGGSRIKLERAGGLGERAEELNRAAAALAKEMAGERTVRRAYAAGDIGPTGELMAPYGHLEYEEAVDIFAQQAAALGAGGVDLIWIETMSDLNEARAAIEGALQVTDLPLFCSLSFGRGGRTMMGVTPKEAAQTLWPLGLTAIGANCGEGVKVMEPVLKQMSAALEPDVSSSEVGGCPHRMKHPALIAKPNAGLPRLVGGETVFDLEPAELAAHVPCFIGWGAQIVGACCGSSPEHIAAIAAAVAAV
jgi:5-methyltetrahydrofolate--homocysteine methyltransferase